MSSVPSNVAAYATATSVPDHPVWFQLILLGLWKAALGLCKAGMGLWKAVHFERLLWACGWHSASADVLSALQMHTVV